MIQQKENERREALFHIIFRAETKAGKWFDIFLIISIGLSIGVVMLESVQSYQQNYGELLSIIEWVFTILFTIEYLVRIAIVRKPLKFIFSFYGIIDLVSCLPAYIVLFTPASSGFIVVRALRLLRLFRVLKLSRYLNASSVIWEALKQSRYKIGVFLYFVFMIIIVVGALMYLIEGGVNGFDSIPRSMYWVVVTITTVGYGDIAPQTTTGQFVASLLMIIGYAVIAVPTGIVTAQTARINKQTGEALKRKQCTRCYEVFHDLKYNYCPHCGEQCRENDVHSPENL